LNVQVLEPTPTSRVLAIEVTPEEIARELESVVQDAARKAAMPGFRKGRVPRSMLEQRYGASFQHETLERAIDRACREAFAGQQLVPLMPAEVEDLKYEPGSALSFKAVIEVRPTIEAKNYKGLAATRATREVTDADVEAELARLEESSTVWVDVERPAQADDLLLVDMVRLDARGQVLKSSRRRDVEVRLGAPDLLPAFEEGLTGAVAGESRTLKVSYPADFGNAELSGKDVQFHVKIRKIREKKARPRDDNWAKEVFGVESLADLSARIRLNLEGEARLASRRETEDALVEAALAANDIPVPARWAEARADEELAQMTRGQAAQLPAEQAQELKGRIREAIERQVRREFLLDAIVRQEGLAPGDAEVGEELGKLLAAGGRVAQEFRALPPEQRRARVEDVLTRRKVFDFLLEHANVSEEKASKEAAQPAGA
jgi:trigger factor